MGGIYGGIDDCVGSGLTIFGVVGVLGKNVVHEIVVIMLECTVSFSPWAHVSSVSLVG